MTTGTEGFLINTFIGVNGHKNFLAGCGCVRVTRQSFVGIFSIIQVTRQRRRHDDGLLRVTGQLWTVSYQRSVCLCRIRLIQLLHLNKHNIKSNQQLI